MSEATKAPAEEPDSADAVRRVVQDSLPERIHTALAGYHRFTAEEPPADPKGFAAWHAAAKAALAHVEALVKLVRWAEAPGTAAETAEDGLEDLLGQARRALGHLQGDEDED